MGASNSGIDLIIPLSNRDMGLIIGRVMVAGVVAIVVAYQLSAIRRCLSARQKTRWRFVVLALVGVIHIKFDWYTGQIGIDWLSITFLGASVDWTPESTIVGVSLPAGAVLVKQNLLFRRDLT